MIVDLFKRFKGVDFEPVTIGVFIIPFFSFLFGGVMALMLSSNPEEPSIIVALFLMFFTFVFLNFLMYSSVDDKREAYLTYLIQLIMVAVIPLLIWIFINLKSLFPNWIVIVSFIVALVIIGEILFALNKKKPKNKKDVMKFTTKLKIEALVEPLFILLVAQSVYELMRRYNFLEKLKQLFVELLELFQKFMPVLLKILAVIALIAVSILVLYIIFYGYIRLNSLRYKNHWKKKKVKS